MSKLADAGSDKARTQSRGSAEKETSPQRSGLISKLHQYVSHRAAERRRKRVLNAEVGAKVLQPLVAVPVFSAIVVACVLLGIRLVKWMDLPPFINWLLSLVAFPTLFAIAFMSALLSAERVHRFTYRRAMKDRQGLAQLILTAIKDGRSPAAEFVLYLRSFQADRSSSRWFAQMASPQTLDYELTHALPDFAVVGLGASDDEELRIGASRLRVRADEWQNVVRKLMEQAKAIVIFPWRSAGVLYELVHIASDANLARKSLLLMPSHLSSSPWLSEVSTEARGVSEEQLAEEEWNASRESLARSRIEFPSYRSSGGIFDFHGWIVPLPANRDEFRQLVLAKVGSVGKGSTALVVGKQLSARLSAERFRVYVLPLGYFREELGEGILGEHGLGGRVDPFAFDVLPGRSTSILLRNKKRHLQWMSAQWGLSAPKGTHGTTEEERENLHTAVVIDETEPTNKYHDAFLNRRCLIPIHHWYERDAMDGEGCREVWRVYSEDNRPLPVAGIWQRTRDGTRSIEFAILAYDSVEALGAIHHRMPVILGQEGAKLWLAESVTNFSQLRLLFHPGLSLGLKTGQWRL